MSTEASLPPSPKLLDRVRQAIRLRHYSPRTEQAYVHWIKRYIVFNGMRNPVELGEDEVTRFLSHLALDKHVSASTQNQAFNALLFLYRNILDKQLGLVDALRAKRPRRLPVVLTREEVRQLFSQLEGPVLLVCTLLFGAGLRLLECLQLRVKDIDLERNEILVRDGKGGRDRVTVLPASCKRPLADHNQRRRETYLADLRKGRGRAPMPDALIRKYPHADCQWGWQYVFVASSHYIDRRTGIAHRHHLHETVVQKAVAQAARRGRSDQARHTALAPACVCDRASS